MTSPVPRTGSATFSTTRGDPKDFSTAAFMRPILPAFAGAIQAWYYPRTESPRGSMADDRRNEVGDFLRSRRERLNPQAVGLPPGRRRRTPGLRREEVAELAGIGVDWDIRLEHGRTVRPSPATVEQLALAPLLDDPEAAPLRTLAHSPEPRVFQPESAPEATRHLVENLSEPAYLTGRRWDLLAWNTAATDLFGDFGRAADEDQNILVYLLLDP